MRGTTKTFIETNINLIENQDWLTLYQGWYDTAYGEIVRDVAMDKGLVPNRLQTGFTLRR